MTYILDISCFTKVVFYSLQSGSILDIPRFINKIIIFIIILSSSSQST